MVINNGNYEKTIGQTPGVFEHDDLQDVLCAAERLSG